MESYEKSTKNKELPKGLEIYIKFEIHSNYYWNYNFKI
jgi:hypothetical protein